MTWGVISLAVLCLVADTRKIKGWNDPEHYSEAPSGRG